MEIQQFLSIIRVRKFIIIQAVLVIFVVSLAFSLTQKPVYKASATILLKEKNLGSSILFGDLMRQFSAQPERSLQTQLKLLTIRPVLQKVVNKLNLRTAKGEKMAPEELLSKIEVTPEGQANMVTVSVKDTAQIKAKEIANTLINEYLVDSKLSNSSEVSQASIEVAKKLKDTEDGIIVLAREIAKKRRNENVPDDLKAKMDMATGLYVMLSEKYEQLRISEKLNTGEAYLVSPAEIPNSPISPKPMVNGVLSIIGGLIFGFGLAMVAEQLDNTIKTSAETEKLLDLPVIGQIPTQEELLKGDGQIIVRTKPKSAAAEAYRTVRTNIQYFNIDEKLKTILITSGSPQEGKTLLTANLAMAIAQTGKKVAIVCCDLRRPSLHKLYHISNESGLSNYLAGYTSINEIMHRIEGQSLTLIPSGPIPPNPSELLGSKKMEALIEELKLKNDFVIIDTAPVLAVTDCAVLAKYSDGVIYVVRSKQTKKESVKVMRSSLENTGIKPLGAVLNGMSMGESYPYYSYRGYVYSDDTRESRKVSWFRKRAIGAGLVAIPVITAAVYLIKNFLR